MYANYLNMNLLDFLKIKSPPLTHSNTNYQKNFRFCSPSEEKSLFNHSKGNVTLFTIVIHHLKKNALAISNCIFYANFKKTHKKEGK